MHLEEGGKRTSSRAFCGFERFGRGFDFLLRLIIGRPDYWEEGGPSSGESSRRAGQGGCIPYLPKVGVQ